MSRFFVAKLRIKSKTTKNNIISSYKEDYFLIGRKEKTES